MNSNTNSKGSRTKKKRKGNFCYDFVKITGGLPALIWFRIKKLFPYGKVRTPKGAVLISANHRSFTDPIIVHCAFAARRLNCLATKELFNTKRKKKFFNLMNCIETDKDNFSISSFHEVVSRLEDGKAVVIFPEGQINTENRGSILTFKSGAVLMAHKSGAPILPIYIAKREKWYKRQIVVVGKPIDVSGELGKIPTIDDLTRVSAMLRDYEIELQNYYYEKYGLPAKNSEIPEGATK